MRILNDAFVLTEVYVIKTSKEFFERLEKDEEFAKEVDEALKSKRESGAKNYYETFIPVAEEKGYKVTAEDIDAVVEQASQELTEEELGKVAGGTSCLPATVCASFLVGTVVTVVSFSVATKTVQ